MRNCLAQSRPVPSSPEQLTAVESSTTQSCSVKEKPSALRPVHSSQVLFGKVHIEAHTSVFQSSTFQSWIAQVHISQQQSSLVQSSEVLFAHI